MKYLISEDEIPESINFVEILEIEPALKNFSISKNLISTPFVVKQDISGLNRNSIEDKKEISTDLENQSIASETIALIYERQGAISQAIKIYQRLIELEPEKKEYYQNKIKDLEKSLNF
ncbi:MAG: hypothetical protein N2319_06200 [Candidatus Kapabacteria bacterium]|nr:hypothetical protein [Candidatus Kapabacteria bacterium]